MMCYRRSLLLILTSLLLLMPLDVTATYAQADPGAKPEIAPYAGPLGRNTEAVVPFPFIQLIHAMPGVGQIDIYIDGDRVVDDFDYLTATPYFPMVWGTYLIDVVAGNAADNTNPLSSSTVRLRRGINYAMIFTGRTRPDLLLLDHTRRQSTVPDQVEYILVHTVPTARAIDIRRLSLSEPGKVLQLITNNLRFGQFRGYWRLEPGDYIFQVTNADNTMVLGDYGQYYFDFSAYEGRSFLLLVATASDGGPATLLGVLPDGHTFYQDIVADRNEAMTTEVSERMAVQGNYPNPFNPSTTIAFDLPEAADVHVDVFDVLGRTVMTTPVRHVAAGTHTIDIDAPTLASGTYFYRVTAQTATRTMTQTKHMVLAE